MNTKTVKWFGFRLYLIEDMAYELPVDFTVTKASASEIKETEDFAPIIDIRKVWKGDETKQFKDTDLVYSYNGKVYFVDEKGRAVELVYKGYDKSRDSSCYGFHPKYIDKRIYRIPLGTDKRIFTRVARNSKKRKRLYAMRSGIERMNGRIDRNFKFEKHTIRGLEKMEMFLTVTFLVSLTLAKAKVERETKEGLSRLYA